MVRTCGSCMDLLSENEVYQKAQLCGGELCSLQENGPRPWAQRFPSFVCMCDKALRPRQPGPCPGLCDSEGTTLALLCFCLSYRVRSQLGQRMYPPGAHMHCHTLDHSALTPLYLKPRIPCPNGLRPILELLWVSFLALFY